jgi:plasmid stabilization system protein ParE
MPSSGRCDEPAGCVRPKARADFDEAFDWYEQQRTGLGVEFAERVHAAFESISAMPELHAPIYRDVRRALVRRFPYSVIYRIRGDQVVVLAVFHNKRDPRTWQSRA